MATEVSPTVTVIRTPVSVMALTMVALLFNGYDLNVYGAAVPFLLQRADWALSPQFAGVIGAACEAGTLVGSVIAGVLTDRYGRRRVYLTTMSIFSVGSALCAVAPNPGFLLCARVLLGLGLGGFIPSALAMVAEYSTVRHRAFATTVSMAGISVGAGLGAVVAINLAPMLGYQTLFWVGAAPLLIVLPFALAKTPESVSLLLAKGRMAQAQAQILRFRLPVELVARDSPATGTGRPAGLLSSAWSLLTRERFRPTMLFWLANLLSLLLVVGTLTWLATLMTNAGYPLAVGLALLGMMQLGSVLMALFGSPVADLVGLKLVVLVSLGCSVLGLALLATHPPVGTTYLLAVLIGAGAGGAQNLIASYLAAYYPPAIRGSGIGIALAFGHVGGVIGPVIGGALVSGGVSTGQSLLVFALAPLLAIVVLAFGPRVEPGRRQDRAEHAEREAHRP